MNTANSNSIPTYKAVIYAGPAFALAVVGIPIYVYVPKFYSDVVGIEIMLMGYLLFSVRIFDAIIDPLIGYLSDRTRSRFGRRRPDIAIGSLFLAFSLLLLWLMTFPYDDRSIAFRLKKRRQDGNFGGGWAKTLMM